MTLLTTYVRAVGKLHATTENERHGRPVDPALKLDDEEAAIVLTVLQVETGVTDADTLSGEERECVIHALQTETEED